jgi:multicomponent Na+:H+ antiporter subunit B
MKSGMTPIVRWTARFMTPFIMVLGFYVILHGHLTPGGGFAGGVFIGGAYFLMVLAYGSDEAKSVFYKRRASLFECAGIFVFWFLAVLGLLRNGVFFLNVLQNAAPGKPYAVFSAGIIPLCNLAIGIEVAAGLFSMFITLAVLSRKEKP